MRSESAACPITGLVFGNLNRGILAPMATVRPWLAFGIAVATGCSLLVDPYELSRSSPPNDAAPPPEDSSLPDTSRTCDLRVPPTAPNGPDTDSGAPLTFALRTFRGTSTIGFDLDGRCTGAGVEFGDLSKSSCVARANTFSLADGDGGVDNATSELLRTAGAAAGVNEDVLGFGEFAADGRQTILIEVNRFSGLSDDPDVTVTVGESPGLMMAEPCNDGGSSDSGIADGGSDSAGDANLTPSWLGCDTWHVAPIPPSESKVAWVRSGTLVAQFDLLPVRFGDVYLRLRGVVATLNPQKKLVVSGRIDPAELVNALGEVVFAGGPLCTNAPLFNGLRQLACDGADLYSGTDAEARSCNTLSFAAEFDAIPARSGAPRSIRPLPERCRGTPKVACAP